jgi:UrcA family protein
MRTIFTNVISAAASVGFTVLAVAASVPAAATTVDQAPRAVVRIADLDLASAAGRRTAMRRIDAAAERVCDAAPGDRLGSESCRAQAVAQAGQALHRMAAPERVASR